MSNHIPADQLQAQAAIVAAPIRRNRGERVFDIHPAVHAMTAAAYLAFVAILASAFMGPHLVVPAAICIVSVIALFATPAMWARVAGDELAKASWAEFMREGVECLTGKLQTRDALAQILVLPGLMVGLALVMVTIRAAV